MKIRQSIQTSRARSRRAGWTLIEMMVTTGIATMMLASFGAVYFFTNRTLDATLNYEELDRQSRNALDLMTVDIRECGGLTNYSTTLLQFTNQDGSLLQFSWDGTNQLTYTNASTTIAGCPRGGTLLKGCGYLKFSVFQRNPISGTTMTFTPASNAAVVKVIVMDWICRRTNYITLTDSESVQTAKVVMRN